MSFKFIKFTGLIFVFFACRDPKLIPNISSEIIPIEKSIKPKPSIENLIKPYRLHIEKSMNEVLCYSINAHTKKEGSLNTAIGNMMADAVFELSAPLLKKHYGLNLDVVLLNYGGIRASLPKGPIRIETAYNIMPFENEVVVSQMKGSVVMDLVNYLRIAKRAHPISGMTLKITKSGELGLVEIQNKPIDLEKTYNIATSDYLHNGGDRMKFFKKNDSFFKLDYKIRNILIDYFSSQDTLKPKADMRFTYTKNNE